jgi:hypothetical protein
LDYLFWDRLCRLLDFLYSYFSRISGLLPRILDPGVVHIDQRVHQSVYHHPEVGQAEPGFVELPLGQFRKYDLLNQVLERGFFWNVHSSSGRFNRIDHHNDSGFAGGRFVTGVAKIPFAELVWITSGHHLVPKILEKTGAMMTVTELANIFWNAF